MDAVHQVNILWYVYAQNIEEKKLILVAQLPYSFPVKVDIQQF